MWQSLWMERPDSAGLEYLALQPMSAHGSIIGHEPDLGAFRIEYEVQWDERWCTTQVELAVARGRTVERRLDLKQRGGTWRNEKDEELGLLQGCIDVDIWPTPFTNSLPIRRLQLAEGERQLIEVVYINAFESSIEKAVQAYTCIGSRSFRFESVGSDFAADLTVDGYGLVLDYPGLFARLGVHE